jgi:hypothetical protein
MRDLPRGTQVVDPEAGSLSSTGLSPALAHRSRCVRLTTDLVTPQELGRAPMFDSYNPRSETAAAYHADPVWAVPVSLATTQGIISFPPATEMFQFAGLPPPGLCVQPGVTGHDPSRVSPFGHPRITVCSRLPEAFRSLPRPSSALGAKASTPCPV